MSKKLWTVIALCGVFGLVLLGIHELAMQRNHYRSSPLLVVDDYRMIIRSMKYGLLLVVMVFTVFFLSEILQNWRIHPVQYLLVGAALSIFYLLLLSLAEHIGFVAAYVIGALACITLLAWYLRFVLATKKGVHLMVGMLCVAYSAMFVLLKLQQYNLVLGSCLMFLSLFAVMYYTRNIDWYAVGGNERDGSASIRRSAVLDAVDL